MPIAERILVALSCRVGLGRVRAVLTRLAIHVADEGAKVLVIAAANVENGLAVVDSGEGISTYIKSAAFGYLNLHIRPQVERVAPAGVFEVAEKILRGLGARQSAARGQLSARAGVRLPRSEALGNGGLGGEVKGRQDKQTETGEQARLKQWQISDQVRVPFVMSLAGRSVR